MKSKDRKRFDALLEKVLHALPRKLHDLLDEAPLIVEDYPDPKLLKELGMDPEEESLCGLHSGLSITERSVETTGDQLEMIHLFREGVIEESGGWEAGEEAVAEEIRVTLLHEIGHHFGLEEEDLEELGFD